MGRKCEIGGGGKDDDASVHRLHVEHPRVDSLARVPARPHLGAIEVAQVLRDLLILVEKRLARVGREEPALQRMLRQDVDVIFDRVAGLVGDLDELVLTVLVAVHPDDDARELLAETAEESRRWLDGAVRDALPAILDRKLEKDEVTGCGDEQVALRVDAGELIELLSFQDSVLVDGCTVGDRRPVANIAGRRDRQAGRCLTSFRDEHGNKACFMPDVTVWKCEFTALARDVPSRRCFRNFPKIRTEPS